MGSRAGLRWLWLSALVIALDQYTKWLALGALREFERVAVVDGILGLDPDLQRGRGLQPLQRRPGMDPLRAFGLRRGRGRGLHRVAGALAARRALAGRGAGADHRRRARQRDRPPAPRARGRLRALVLEGLALAGVQRRRLGDHGGRGGAGPVGLFAARPAPRARRGGSPRAGARIPAMEVLLANPRGFCAGVDRAIEIVERALEAVRRADLRAPRDRAQPLRGRQPARAGRGLRRRTGRRARRRHRGVQRARRLPGGAARVAQRASCECSTRPVRW